MSLRDGAAAQMLAGVLNVALRAGEVELAESLIEQPGAALGRWLEPRVSKMFLAASIAWLPSPLAECG